MVPVLAGLTRNLFHQGFGNAIEQRNNVQEIAGLPPAMTATNGPEADFNDELRIRLCLAMDLLVGD